jgi:peptide/nickel transport system substrate-binding protein
MILQIIVLLGSVFVGNNHALANSAVRYALGSDIQSFDPAATTDAESQNVCENIFDGLLRYKAGTLELEPALATSWKYSDDLKTLTFVLRKGVKFQDGTPFNASAVAFSLLRQFDKSHEAHGFVKEWGYWNDLKVSDVIESMSTPKDDIVEIKLKQADGVFLSFFAMTFTSIVSPTAVRKYKSEFYKNPVGTGSFQLKHWRRNDVIELQRSKIAWENPTSTQRLLFKVIPDTGTRLNAFLKSEIDILNAPTMEQAKTLEKKLGDMVQLVSSDSLNTSYLAFNTSKSALSDKRVRQAMSFAFDKNQFVRAFFDKFADVAVNPIPPLVFGYNHRLKNRTVDLDKARALLAEAGVPKGFQTTLTFPQGSKTSIPNGKGIAEFFQFEMKKIGIDVQLQTFEWATYLSHLREGQHDIALMGWTGDNTDADAFLSYLFHSRNAKAPASNIAFLKNSKLDQLLDKAKGTIDLKVKKKFYEDVQSVIFDEAPWIPFAHVRPTVAIHSRVKNFVIGPDGSKRLSQVLIRE